MKQRRAANVNMADQGGSGADKPRAKPAFAPHDGIRLYARRGWGGCYIPIMLSISLVLNILALSTSFLEFSMWFHSTLNYNLPHMVLMMWNDGLHIIAMLILFFSIIFPLFKLAIMFIVWFWPRTFNRQKRLHELVRNLGKWSFMDIFVVALLLALTNNQAAVHAVPQVGVYFFIAAILLSMLTSELLHRILHTTAIEIGASAEPRNADQVTCPLFTLRFLGWLIGVLLIAAMIALFAAIGFPFLEINQAFLSGYSYDIFETIKAVFNQNQPVVGTMLAAFLIVTPCIRVLGTIFLWFGACRLGRRLACVRILNIFARWSMIDVFGLALILILTEGQEMIKTDVHSGAYILVAAIVLTVVLPAFATWLDPVRGLPKEAQEI
ncbi:MAG: paraquat-inducible protein A [Phycisphaerales bacterium]|nr:paraquat-inducible protein A [Phycisphaerales bacterium]